MTSAGSPTWGAVIVAAGRGERFGEHDKTLALLAGRPVFEWSLDAFQAEPRIRKIAVVVSDANHRECMSIVERAAGEQAVVMCRGGENRAASVRAGLLALEGGVDFVAVHDCARPLAAAQLLARVLDAAESCGAAVPVLPVSSTLLIESAPGESAGPLRRERVREVQTPQAARLVRLMAALEAFPDETDESSALYRAGIPVALVEGQRANIKITERADLLLAEALLALRNGDR